MEISGKAYTCLMLQNTLPYGTLRLTQKNYYVRHHQQITNYDATTDDIRPQFYVAKPRGKGTITKYRRKSRKIGTLINAVTLTYRLYVWL